MGTRSVGCSPDKPMLLIISSHEKQTAIKPRASRERERVYPMNSNEELSAIGVASPTLIVIVKVYGPSGPELGVSGAAQTNPVTGVRVGDHRDWHCCS